MQNATVSTAVTANNAAAVAVTFRVLQLASTVSDPALPSGQGQQMLQSINTAAQQAAPDDLGILTTCLAEILAFQGATGSLVCKQNKSHIAAASLRLLLLPKDTSLLLYVGRN